MVEILIAVGELLLLVTAYQITTRRDIPQVIRAYQWQSAFLAFTALLIALLDPTKGIGNPKELFTSQTLLAIALIALLPIALVKFIDWIQARATIYDPKQGSSLRRLSDQERQLAHAVWLAQRHIVSGQAGFHFLGLALMSFVIVFGGIIDVEVGEKLGLSVSLTLHLVGLYNTVSRKDILTQVIGVLTMDHALYLAIVKIVNIPVPATLFVIALYFYTIITVLILFLVVPQLRHVMGAINLDEIKANSELEG